MSLTNVFGYSVVSSIRSGTLRIIYSDVTTSKIINHTVVLQNYVPLANMAVVTTEAFVIVKFYKTLMLSMSEPLILILNVHIYM